MKWFLPVFLFIQFGTTLYSQSSVVPWGMDASGINGNISATIGLTDYESQTGGQFVITQGVQQPYEFFISDFVEQTDEFSIVVFPNPAKDDLCILTNEKDFNYVVFDMLGKKCLEGSSDILSTQISIQSLSTGSYMLQVYVGSYVPFNFQFIKTN